MACLEETDDYEREEFDIVMEIVYGLVVIIGIMANLLVIVVHTLDKKRKRSNLGQFVFNLVVADIIHLLSSTAVFTKLANNHIHIEFMDTKISVHHEDCFAHLIHASDLEGLADISESVIESANRANNWKRLIGNGLLIFDSLIFYVGFFCSITILTFMAVDRCVLIVCTTGPAQMRQLFRNRSTLWIALGWILSIALSSCFVWIEHETCPEFPAKHENQSQCGYLRLKYGAELGSLLGNCTEVDPCDDYEYEFNFDYDYEISPSDKFIGSVSLVLLILPTLIIPISYILIVRRVRNSAHLTNRFQTNDRSNKLIIMVLTIISVFILCWTPFFTVSLYEKITQTNVNHQFYQVVSCLPYISSLCNPFIYSIFSSKFQESFKVVFGRCRQKHGSYILRPLVSVPITETYTQ